MSLYQQFDFVAILDVGLRKTPVRAAVFDDGGDIGRTLVELNTGFDPFAFFDISSRGWEDENKTTLIVKCSVE